MIAANFRATTARHRRFCLFSAVRGFKSLGSFFAILTGIGSRRNYKYFGGRPNPLHFYHKLGPFSAAHSFKAQTFTGHLLATLSPDENDCESRATIAVWSISSFFDTSHSSKVVPWRNCLTFAEGQICPTQQKLPIFSGSQLQKSAQFLHHVDGHRVPMWRCPCEGTHVKVTHVKVPM